MDILSFAGLGCGLAAIIISMTLDGGNLMSLLQLSALVIVAGGTLGAILLQTPMTVFMRGLKMLTWVFFPPRDDREEYLRLITDWLRIARHQFVLALDPIAEQQTDPFLRQGLRLVVDGVDAPQIRSVLEAVISTRAHEEKLSAEMYEAAGGYAPTVGILGAVMGLITVMSPLDDPSERQYGHKAQDDYRKDKSTDGNVMGPRLHLLSPTEKAAHTGAGVRLFVFFVRASAVECCAARPRGPWKYAWIQG